MRVRSAGCCLAFALTLPSIVIAAPRDYRIDPVHSRVVFAVDHAGFARALGTLSAPRGWLRVDDESWNQAAVEVEVDLDRVDLGDEKWNQRMARRDFFHLARHPTARFTSRKVTAIDAEHARVEGDLELRGQTRPLTLEITRGGIGRHPLTLRRTVGFSARAELKRSDFGMVAWKSLVGDAVDLRIEVEATREHRPRSGKL